MPEPIENHRIPNAPPDSARVAFRELHARRLHGFALLLVLGDRARAARLAADALAAAAERIDTLRHPERAAAWLRQHAVRHAGGERASRPADPRVLADLGADPGVIAALALLGPRERAALIASAVEGLDRRDVATIVGRNGATLDRLLRRARGRYVAGYAAVTPPSAGDGPLAARIHAVAERAMT
jgi:DNA-directed RNA polymerase specialized sigma24 family protein